MITQPSFTATGAGAIVIGESYDVCVVYLMSPNNIRGFYNPEHSAGASRKGGPLMKLLVIAKIELLRTYSQRES